MQDAYLGLEASSLWIFHANACGLKLLVVFSSFEMHADGFAHRDM
jgi:hypothetical protein